MHLRTQFIGLPRLAKGIHAYIEPLRYFFSYCKSISLYIAIFPYIEIFITVFSRLVKYEIYRHRLGINAVAEN